MHKTDALHKNRQQPSLLIGPSLHDHLDWPSDYIRGYIPSGFPLSHHTQFLPSGVR